MTIVKTIQTSNYLKWYFIKSCFKINFKFFNLIEYYKLKQIDFYFNNLYFILYSLNKYISEIILRNNEYVLVLINPNDLLFILNFFLDHYKIQAKELVDICAIDYIHKLKRFEITYNLLSLKYKIRFRIKINITEQDIVTSSTLIYASANWLERELWDTYGIFFLKHPDLRRILTDYGFVGFPFRKDFPLSGYIELRYDYDKKLVIYDKLEMAQEFRFFEFNSPWEFKI